MIRDARFTDVKKIARLCEEIRGRSVYSDISGPLDAIQTKGIVMDAIMLADRGEAKVLVYEDGDDLKGIFVGTRKPLYEVSEVLLASAVVWYTSPGVSPIISMRLAQRFYEWAKQADGPLIIRLAVTDAVDNPASAARALEKTMGFRCSGLVLEKEIA